MRQTKKKKKKSLYPVVAFCDNHQLKRSFSVIGFEGLEETNAWDPKSSSHESEADIYKSLSM